MSTSQAVVQHLPFLRRYARALSGSQSSGDAYVAATLESLITEPKALESLPNQRVALYRLFTKIWNSVTLNGKAEGAVTSPGLAPEQHITQITPRPRQAFLLVALEGFSEDEAAQILEVDLPTLRGLVEESGRELAAEIVEEQRLADGALKAEIRQEMVRPVRHRVFEADRVGDGVEAAHLAATPSGIAAVTETGGCRPFH